MRLLVSVLCGVIVLLSLLVILGSRDAEDYDDHGLIALASRPLPPEENGYAAIDYLMEDGFDLPLSDTARSAMMENKPIDAWDSEVLRKTLEANTTHIDSLVRASAYPYIDLPLAYNWLEIPLYQNLLDVLKLLRISSVVAIRRGEVEEGLGLLGDALRFTQKLKQKPGGPILNYVVTSSMQEQVLDSIRRLAASSVLDAGDLRNLRAVFKELPEYPRDAFEHVIAKELYQLELLYSRQFGSSLRERWHDFAVLWIKRDEIEGVERDFTLVTLQHFLFVLFPRYFWHHNENMAVITDLSVELVAQTGKPCSELELQKTGDQWENYSSIDLFWPNAGSQSMESMEATWRDYFYRRCLNATALDATETVIAMHEYRLSEGEFPMTLGALVPAYMARLPLDAFDGESIRFDRNQGFLYSVGTDFSDAGGSLDSIYSLSVLCLRDEQCMTNPTFPLEPAGLGDADY